MNLELLYKQAVGFHQGGNLVEAERLYTQILAAAPFNFNASYLLGLIRAQQERNAEALKLIGAALKIGPMLFKRSTLTVLCSHRQALWRSNR